MLKKMPLGIGLLIAMLIAGLAGCGGQDETPAVSKTRQTQGLVPESVTQSDELKTEGLVEEIDQVESEVKTLVPESASEAADIEIEAIVPVAEEKAPVKVPPVPTNGIFSLQLGSYTIASYAEDLAARLRDLGHSATVEQAEVGGQLYHRVFIRGLADRQSAEKLGEELHTNLDLSYLILRK